MVQRILVANGVTPISSIVLPYDGIRKKGYQCIQATWDTSKLVVVVRPAGNLPGWSLPLRVFSARIWGALAATALAYALAWRVVSGDGALRCLTATLAALSSCGGVAQARIRALPQRLQLAGALLASSVVIAASYQVQLPMQLVNDLIASPTHEGRLYSLVAKPERFPEIDTLEQLADSSVPVVSYGVPGYLKFLIDTKTEGLSPAQLLTRRRIIQQGIRLISLDELMMMVIQHQNVAFLLGSSAWKTSSREVLCGRKVHNLKESFSKEGTCLIITANWPWIYVVEDTIWRMRQAGLYQHAYEMSIYVWNQYHPDRAHFSFKDEKLKTTRVLQLADLLPHLELLVVGILLAITCFVGELLLRHRSVSSCGPPPHHNPESCPPLKPRLDHPTPFHELPPDSYPESHPPPHSASPPPTVYRGPVYSDTN
ncbi:Ionotropic receptor 881 [Gryllus bimaculatus]|nr:Ionotropic receptor 881 [Gryllus bimaculatus]